MRKFRILAAFLAAVVLSGCSRTPSVPQFSFSEPVSISSSENSGSVSENSSTQTSAADEDEKQPEINGNEFGIILDPINVRTLVFNENKITLSGKMGESFTPSINIPHTEKYEKNGDNFTYTAEINSNFTGYGNISVCKNGSVRIYAEKGKVSLVEVPEVELANENAVKNAIEQPLSQVSEYIAINADKAKIAEVLKKITEISDKICAGLTNDYDKLRAISRWVSANIYYDYAAFEAGVPAETLTLDYMLKNSSSVCGGYSNMTSALAAAQGIKVYNVHGSAVTNGKTFAESSGEYHEWNYAIIGGRVIRIDSGWNSYCYHYADGKYVKGEIGIKYFDISAAAFSQNHKAKYAEYRDYFALLEG